MFKKIEELCMQVLEDVKGRWDFYRHAAYLKERGWTEEQFQRTVDPDRNPCAGSVNAYYQGYPRHHVFTSTRVAPFTRYSDWTEAYDKMQAWCKESCKDKWRDDILRVSRKRMWHNQSDNTMRYTDDGE